MADPEFSVVVPAYQAEDQIALCLGALEAQTVPRGRYEVIVADDGSTDGTAAAARAAGADQVLVLPHGGPAAARNAGAQAARAEIVIFTDVDCRPSPAWLEHMVAPFSDPQVAATKGTYTSQQEALVARLVQLEYEIRYQRMAGLPCIDFVDTYAAAYRRELLLAYGGFDAVYPVPSAEDVDLAFRLARDGHRFLFVPQAQVQHQHPESLRAYLARKALYGYWRALLYLRYPEKAGGDAHTDPGLKLQFVLAALTGLAALGALAWWPLAAMALVVLVGFLLTTLPFVRWAWPRDRAVASVWPAVALLRALMQGTGLAVGLAYHGLLRRLHRSGGGRKRAR